MYNPTKLISELGNNANPLIEFKRALELQQLGKKTINLHLFKAYQILRHYGKPAAEITRQKSKTTSSRGERQKPNGP